MRTVWQRWLGLGPWTRAFVQALLLLALVHALVLRWVIVQSTSAAGKSTRLLASKVDGYSPNRFSIAHARRNGAKVAGGAHFQTLIPTILPSC